MRQGGSRVNAEKCEDVKMTSSKAQIGPEPPQHEDRDAVSGQQWKLGL